MIKFLRRRRLGRTSVRGMIERMDAEASEVRSWVDREANAITDTDIVVRWGCTASINCNNILNTARAIHQVNDKAGFRMHLMEHAPDLIPETWDTTYDPITYPCIVRPVTHSRGRNLCLVNGVAGLDSAIRQCGNGWYASEYINKVAEYRVFVVQGRAVAVAQKTPANPDDVAWNVAQGGRFDNVSWDNWPLQAVRKSIEAFNLSELDFGGVDVIVDGDGRAYVIEINSAPSLTSDYRQTCMAKAFDWMSQNGKERIPLIEERGGYRKFIHPAVCDRAILPDVLQHAHEPVMTFVDEPSDEEMNEMNAGEILGEERTVGEMLGHDLPYGYNLSLVPDVVLIEEMNRRRLR